MPFDHAISDQATLREVYREAHPMIRRKVVDRIERDLAPGAIVLLHEGATHGRNVETVSLLLQRLDTLGYRTILPEAL